MARVKRWVPLLLMMICMVGFSACSAKLRVENAQQPDIVAAMYDFAAQRGYDIMYANPRSGHFRVFLGEDYQAGYSESREETVNVVKPGPNNNRKEKRTVVTHHPPKYVNYIVNLQVLQQGESVLIIAECEDEGPAESSCDGGRLMKFMKYLTQRGYQNYILKD
jgi:hypothetical protein